MIIAFRLPFIHIHGTFDGRLICGLVDFTTANANIIILYTYVCVESITEVLTLCYMLTSLIIFNRTLHLAQHTILEAQLQIL